MARVSILTHSFVDAYNQRLDQVFGGGLERYIYDLCGVIKELGMHPEIHQLAYAESFFRVVDDIPVYGHLCDLARMHESFAAMAQHANGFIIYASFIWHPMEYSPGSMAICHGINWDQASLPRPQKAQIAENIQHALTHLNLVVSVDSHFVSYCRSVCTYSDPDHVLLLPNAVDTNRFVPGDVQGDGDAVRILFPRRISPERGVISMMLAADVLLSEYEGVEIEFAGETVIGTPLATAFQHWLQVHPHKQRIAHRVYDFVDVVKAYQGADVVAIPTIFSEGTSYSCLEAMSCGVPVVASNVGGLNDLVTDGFNGLLCTPNHRSLTEALRYLIDNPDVRRKLGQNARQTAFAFDLGLWKQRWKIILKQQLGLGGAGT